MSDRKPESFSSPPPTVNPLFVNKSDANPPRTQEAAREPLSSALRLLSEEWRKFEGERVSWHSEKERLQAQIKECEEEIRKQDSIRRALFERLQRLETDYSDYKNTSPTRDPPRSSPQSPSSPTLSTPDPRKGTRNPSLEVHMHTYAHAPKWKVSSERVVFPKLSPRQRMGEDGVLRPFDLPLSLSKEFIASLSKETYLGVLGMTGGSSSAGARRSGTIHRTAPKVAPTKDPLPPPEAPVSPTIAANAAVVGASASSRPDDVPGPSSRLSGAPPARKLKTRKQTTMSSSSSAEAAWKKRFLTMKSHQSAVRVLAFGESLQMLFSGGDDGFVLGWNMEPLLGNAVGAGAAGSKKVSPKFNMTVHQDVPITGLVFLEEAEELISGSSNGVVCRWRVQDQEARRTGGRILGDLAPGGSLSGLVFHPPTGLLAVLLPGEVGLWSVSRPSVTLSPGVEDGLKGGTLEQVLLTVEDTSPSPVERFVATLRLEGNENPTCAKFLHGQPSLRVAVSSTSRVYLFDVCQQECLWSFSHSAGPPLSMLGVAGSTSLLCAHESRSIRVLDTDTGEEITEWVAHSGAILGVDVFPQQDFVASGDSNSSLRFWTPPDFRCSKEFELRCQGKGITTLRFHPSIPFLAVGCGNGQIMVFLHH